MTERPPAGTRGASAVLAEANRLFASGNHAASEALFEELVVRGERTAEARHGLGLIALSRGDVREAWSHLEESVRVNPANADALYVMGQLAERAGDRDAAIALYGEALSHDPRHKSLTRLVGIGGAPAAARAAPEPDVWRARPEAIAPEPTRPAPRSPSPPPASTRQPPRPPNEPRSRDSYVGVVRSLQKSAAPWRGRPAAAQQWDFLLETYDSAGNPSGQFSVEMRGNEIKGNLIEGQWVEIERGAKQRGGALEPKRIRNLSTNAEVRRVWRVLTN
jgi:tetratricopeptide (TPR) repeat protein